MQKHLTKKYRFYLVKRIGFLCLLVSLLGLEVLSNSALAQEQSRRHIIRERQVSSGYFEDVDVSSTFYLPLVGGPKEAKDTSIYPHSPEHTDDGGHFWPIRTTG